jgi:hypothetical protein
VLYNGTAFSSDTYGKERYGSGGSPYFWCYSYGDFKPIYVGGEVNERDEGKIGYRIVDGSVDL